MKALLVAVMGPTASGKTAVAEALADHLDAQLVNADAFQVYRGLDIGTAKPQDRHRYALLDLKEPEEPFGLGEWLQLAHKTAADCLNQGRSVVVVGGTGLYVRALFEGYDELYASPDPALRRSLSERDHAQLVEELTSRSPEAVERVDLANPVRVRRALEKLETPRLRLPALPESPRVKIGLAIETYELDQRIVARVNEMVAAGWEAEARTLLNRGVAKDAPGLRAIGYRDWYSCFEGAASRTETMANIVKQTRQYAKRQRTWMRSERNLITITGNPNEAIRILASIG